MPAEMLVRKLLQLGMKPKASLPWNPQPNATLGRVRQVLGDALRASELRASELRAPASNLQETIKDGERAGMRRQIKRPLVPLPNAKPERADAEAGSRAAGHGQEASQWGASKAAIGGSAGASTPGQLPIQACLPGTHTS